jgi:hypothetical protein
VRSVSEVFMHIATSNYWLLAQTGAITYPKALDADDIDKTITSKAEVIGWLTKSCDAVKTDRAKENPRRTREKSSYRRPRRSARRHLPAHPGACKRTHGPAHRILADERHRPALV